MNNNNPNTPGREMLLALNKGLGTKTTQYVLPEITLDANGVPSHVKPATAHNANLAGGIFSLEELEAAGLAPDDVPNLKIVDDAGELLEG